MSWEDVENAMQSAISRASGYAADRVFWSYQNVNEPRLDHITITFGGEMVIGIDRIRNSQDLTRPNGQEMKQEIEGVREVPFELSCFTSATSGDAAARRIVELTRTRLRLSDIRVPLKRAGITPFDPGPVHYIPDIPNTTFRGRATCTIRCYVPVTDCAEYTGYIARIRGTVFPIGILPEISGETGIPFDSDAAT